jgi:molecular chaperone HscB
MDHFEIFGLPRKLRLDAAELQQRYYELSRRTHPDIHQGAPPEDQAQILETSARLNAAYRALRHPIARVEYLVRLEEGRETAEGAAVKPKAPPELLAEMFELQEALAEAKAGGLDAGGRERLAAEREQLLARHREEEERLAGPLSEAWDAAAPAERPRLIEAFKEALAARAYLRTVIDDLGAALGESQDGYVANRRH